MRVVVESPRIVHLVDDDAAVRRSLSLTLRTAGYRVRPFESGAALLEACATMEAGCILLDVRMPDIDGLRVQHMLKERGISWPVIVMTAHGDTATAVQAMKGGALDFIEKPFHRADLIAAIEVGFGRLEQAERRHIRADEARALLAVLTPRELDVLEGLVRGHPNKTIGYDLGISPRTVEIHRANLMAKLKVASLSEALRIAFTAGLGDVGTDDSQA